MTQVRRIALTPDQVIEHQLPPLPAKTYAPEDRAVLLGLARVGDPKDPRSKAFELRHGRLFQVELDALRPETLRSLYAAELARWWDEDAYEETLSRERQDLDQL